MRFVRAFGGIRGRMAVLILLAMAALVVMLGIRAIEKRNGEREQNEANLLRLATFAAQAQRERFDTAERLLLLASQSGTALREAAANPADPARFDRCTSGLFVLDQLLPETSGFALWDTSGSIICSSEAARTGEFSAADELWFQTVRERGEFATGDYELSPPDEAPSLGFGVPMKDAAGVTIGYLSTGLLLNADDEALLAANLPETGRIGIVDQNGVILASSNSNRNAGEVVEGFDAKFGGLSDFLGSSVDEAFTAGRTAAAVRVTDADDAAVTLIISADNDVLAAPLLETLLRDLVPVVIVTVLALAAVWLLVERWIARPVGALVVASEALEQGDFSARVRRSGVAELDVLADSFNAMATERERVNHAKDEFMGLVSHELKTPMTTALGNASVLRRSYDQLDTESRESALDDIHDSLLRLAAIIDNMLALARLDRGVGLELEPVLLTRVADVGAQAEAQRALRNVTVTGDRGLVALGSEAYVDQVVRNLVANAFKYSPADRAVEVEVKRRDDRTAVVRVRDHGGGVPLSERLRIFQPFYRSSRTSELAEGIGIGLAVCKRIVESMDGEIWCESAPDGGSVFSFTLPLFVEEAETEAEGPGLRTAATAPAAGGG